MMKHNIKILHVIGSFVAGGAELFVINLLCHLKKKGVPVGVLSLSAKKDSVGHQKKQLLEKAQIPYFTGPTERVHAISAFWYARMLWRISPDIVHLHTVNTELAHYLGTKTYWKKHKIVRTIHSMNRHPNRWYRYAFKKNRVDLSIACSTSVEKQYQKDISRNLITIPNGVDFNWPMQTKELKDHLIRKLNLDKTKRHVINIGRQAGETLNSAPKAQDVLIKAWIRGGLGRKQNTLHLIGGGNLSKDLMRIADGDDSIIFHGIQDNIHEWLLAADLFVMPSRYEGLPIAGIEALGTGLPCIFSDIKPLRELKTNDTRWVKVDDVNDLSRELTVATGNALSVKLDEINRIRQAFGINKTVNQYLESYVSVFS